MIVLSEVYHTVEGRYVDSVLLMQISREVEKMEGVQKAGAMVATPENISFFRIAGFNPPPGVGANSILLAVDAVTGPAADAAIGKMLGMIESGTSGAGRRYRLDELPSQMSAEDYPVMLISTPGQYVRDIALGALDIGANLHIFSSNVPLEQELEIKRRGRDRGLLVMGPDCGTSIIDGHGIGFANKLSPGNDVGVIGSSGTGIQELTVQLDAAGLRVSYAIGTGSNDLTPEVGGITTEQAIAMLRGRCSSIAIVCKKPDPALQKSIIARIQDLPSAFISLGSSESGVHGRTGVSGIIDEAVAHISRELGKGHPLAEKAVEAASPGQGRRLLKGYFVGGSLCYQAQAILHREGIKVFSNSPLSPEYSAGGEFRDRNVCIDTGAEEYVAGRPHPMIDPVSRNSFLVRDSGRADVRVILFDVVLGFGSSPDPLDGLQGLEKGPVAVASICGTAQDSQGIESVRRQLEQKGVVVFRSASRAAAYAAAVMKVE